MKKNRSPLRLAIFDCDGTLVDSQESIVAAMYAAFDHHGFARPSKDAVRRVVGLPLDVAIGCLLPGGGADLAQVMSETYKSEFGDLRRSGCVLEPMFSGVCDVLDCLDADDWLLAIATGKSLHGLKRTLEGHNLMDRFVSHQTGDRAFGKPHPDMILKAMDVTGAEPEFTVMIGDTTFDIEMAKNAGVRAIGVAWGYHDADELRDAGAMCVAHTSNELTVTLQTLKERFQ